MSSGRQSNYQPGKQKRGCRREQAIAAIRVQQERLNVKEPERSEKHRANGWNEKCSRARISEPRERSEGKRAEISQDAEKGHGKSPDLGVRTAQDPETIRRSTTAQRLAR